MPVAVSATPCLNLLTNRDELFYKQLDVLGRFRVLDECDEMLNMGFVDDVEMILNAGGSSENMQTLLFSATLPPWVKDITRRFLRKEQRLVDLVGSQKMKVSTVISV